MARVTTVTLEPSEMPTSWYNVQADMPTLPDPILNPHTREPLEFADLPASFPPELMVHEMSPQRWHTIPDEVQEIYRLWRPTPLRRACRLERLLGTPAKIYFKYEGVSPTGSHKTNTAVPQAFFNKQAGNVRVTTETGAGQWGCALAYACSTFGLGCTVYMVNVSLQQKPYRGSLIRAWGGHVYPSPSPQTRVGRRALATAPDGLGTLGLATSEAMEDAYESDHTGYAAGSITNAVVLHQTIIGLEAKAQLGKIGAFPDIIYGCCGGGSNLGGIAFPFLLEKFNGRNLDVVAVESTAAPKLTKGSLVYDHGDAAGLSPLLKMYTLGHDFVPSGIHAGGLRGHSASPLLSRLICDGQVRAQAFNQNEVFSAGLVFAKCEGILPAPESTYTIKGVIDEAVRCREAREEKTILFCLTGHGHFDMAAYDSYLAGQLPDYEYPAELIASSLRRIGVGATD